MKIFRPVFRGLLLCSHVLIVTLLIQLSNLLWMLSKERRLRIRQKILIRNIRFALIYLGFRVCVEGNLPKAPFVVVSNHLSYMDILVYYRIFPARFVSKEEIRKWPFFGAFANDTGSFFLKRESLKSMFKVLKEMQTALELGHNLLFFPEGTSSGGGRIGKFNSALFEIAYRTKVSILPAAIRYEITGKGSVEEDVCYWKDHIFIVHIIRMMQLKRVIAKISLGEALPIGKNRRETAEIAKKTVEKLFRTIK